MASSPPTYCSSLNGLYVMTSTALVLSLPYAMITPLPAAGAPGGALGSPGCSTRCGVCASGSMTSGTSQRGFFGSVIRARATPLPRNDTSKASGTGPPSRWACSGAVPSAPLTVVGATQ